jgi:hypothetical protein
MKTKKTFRFPNCKSVINFSDKSKETTEFNWPNHRNKIIITFYGPWNNFI